LLAGVCPDPAGVLGPLDPGGDGRGALDRIRVFLPPALRVEAGALRRDGREEWMELTRVHPEGVFEGSTPAGADGAYRLRVHWDSGDVGELEDPYRFQPTIRPDDLAAFADGEETRLDRVLGATRRTIDGVTGTRFSVWAPRAMAVNLMGSFNGWEGRRNPMRPLGDTGIWELFLPDVGDGALYKYEIRTSREELTGSDDEVPPIVEKTDPLGREMELRPRTASVVTGPTEFEWTDEEWVGGRPARGAPDRPLSIYEAHLGSWQRSETGEWLGYRELATTLLPYVRELGFTHVELLPVTEHPLDRSWGYQTVGYFAPTSRYGAPDDFRAFVDEAHRLGLGVILDWVPAHFPYDAHGLWKFDGAALYEHPDPQRGHHPDWGTAIFDYGRPEVVSFLLSSARFWIDEYHVDGLRVDAVASMLYLDYSRDEGEWEPNPAGGRENLEALAFLRRLTGTLHDQCPGVLLIAEESTAWPGVTSRVSEGGLGFDLKWNMGWMNDSLAAMSSEPERRSEVHEKLTFSLHYAHTERYLLPVSHDEVVHLKRSLASKMPGTETEKLADVRVFLAYMWTHPGAKLLFMGSELGEWREWSEERALDWDLLESPAHRGLSEWVRALNGAYAAWPALHTLDTSPEGFEWVDVHDSTRSVLAYLRWAPDRLDVVAVAANFSNETWSEYRLGLPAEGVYEILLDSDEERFGGEGRTVIAEAATATPHLDRPASIELDLPPRTAVLLRPSRPQRG